MRTAVLGVALALPMAVTAQSTCAGSFDDDVVTVELIRDASAAEGLIAAGQLEAAEPLVNGAIDRAKQIADADPKLLPALYDLHGQVLYRLSRLTEAHDAAAAGLAAFAEQCPEPAPLAWRLLTNLGAYDRALGDFVEAERHLTSVVDTVDWRAEGEIGAVAAEQLSMTLRDTARPAAARALLDRVLQNLPEGDERNAAVIELELARIDYSSGLLDSAERLLERARPKLDLTARQRSHAASLLEAQIQYRRSAFAAARATAGGILAEAEDPSVQILARETLGLIAIAVADPLTAEGHFEAALQGIEATLPADHTDRARQLHNLGLVYAELGQVAQARAYFDEAIGIFRLRGTPSLEAASLLEKGLMLVNRRDVVTTEAPTEAIEAGAAALELLETLEEPDEVRAALAHSTLGFAHRIAGDLSEAERHFSIALASIEKRRGEDSFDLAPGLTELAEIYLARRDYARAASYARRAIEIRRGGNARTPRGVAVSQSVLARVFAAQGKWREALAIADDYLDIMKRRFEISGEVPSSYALGEQVLWESLFSEYLWIAHTAYSEDGRLDARELDALLAAAQYPHLDSTAAVVAELAERYRYSDPASAALLRERQALAEEWRLLDIELANEIGLGAAVERRRAVARAHAEIEARLKALDGELAARGVELGARARPVSAEAIRESLQDDELLLLQLTGAQGTLVAAIAKSAAPQVRFMDVDEETLVGLIREVRRSTTLPRSGSPPDFAAAAAYEIYDRLFAPFDLLSQKVAHLLVVQDRRLQNVPLALLPMERAAAPQYLGHAMAISVLPAASALIDLRRETARPEPQAEFFGMYPNIGKPANADERSLVASAVLETYSIKNRLAPDGSGKVVEGSERGLFDGNDANDLPLSAYRVLLFSTHGYLAGDAPGHKEPGLLISDGETGEYDGYLGLSEVHRLRLNADLVVLSACNTAGPDGVTSGDAFSGLTRAFLQAGSRSLLVSHWPVSSGATYDLMVRVAERGARRRAEALRAAMHAVSQDPRYSHPAYWASFVFVGDGA